MQRILAYIDGSMWNSLVVRLTDEQENLIHDRLQSYLQEHMTLREVCPGCSSINIRKRMTLKPPYVCGMCNHEFDVPLLNKRLPRIVKKLKMYTNQVTNITFIMNECGIAQDTQRVVLFILSLI